jgi:hypothetical protein
VHAIAHLRGESFAAVGASTTRNALRFFGLDAPAGGLEVGEAG